MVAEGLGREGDALLLTSTGPNCPPPWQEYGTLPTFIRGQLSLEQVNEALAAVHEAVTLRADAGGVAGEAAGGSPGSLALVAGQSCERRSTWVGRAQLCALQGSPPPARQPCEPRCEAVDLSPDLLPAVGHGLGPTNPALRTAPSAPPPTGAGFTLEDLEGLGLGPKSKVFINCAVKLGRAHLKVVRGMGTLYLLL